MKRLRILWLLPILAIACLAAYYFQPYDKLPPNTPIDRIVVLKSRHRMTLRSTASETTSGILDGFSVGGIGQTDALR